MANLQQKIRDHWVFGILGFGALCVGATWSATWTVFNEQEKIWRARLDGANEEKARYEKRVEELNAQMVVNDQERKDLEKSLDAKNGELRELSLIVKQLESRVKLLGLENDNLLNEVNQVTPSATEFVGGVGNTYSPNGGDASLRKSRMSKRRGETFTACGLSGLFLTESHSGLEGPILEIKSGFLPGPSGGSVNSRAVESDGTLNLSTNCLISVIEGDELQGQAVFEIEEIVRVKR